MPQTIASGQAPRQMKTRTILTFILTFGLLFELRSQPQSDSSNPNKICEAISLHFNDPDINCIYDTLFYIGNPKNDSSFVFAVGTIDISGKATKFVDIFVSKGLTSFKRMTRDTLLTEDCVPCDDPREIIGIKVRKSKKTTRVTMNCSYFYNRHQMAGTIYRSFVYDISFTPTTLHRNLDKENKLRRAEIGEISGG